MPTDNPYPLGRRELQADFSGTRSSNLSVTRRPDALTFDYLRAFSLGPVELGDVSDGILAWAWSVRASDDGKVWLARETDAKTGWRAETELFSFTGEPIIEIDLAFNQAGQVNVCVSRATGGFGAQEVWLYWYEPFLAAFSLIKYDSGRTPRLLLDNPPDSTRSDVQFFYLKTGVGMVYRQQRDRFLTLYTTPHVVEADWFIEEVFYTQDWRVAVVLSHHTPGGTYDFKRLETSLMPVYGMLEEMTAPLDLQVAILKVIKSRYYMGEDLIAPLTLQSAELKTGLIPHVLFDIETLVGPIDLLSATLREILIIRSLYDIELLVAPLDLESADLRVIYIRHSLYDHEDMVAPFTLQTADMDVP